MPLHGGATPTDHHNKLRGRHYIPTLCALVYSYFNGTCCGCVIFVGNVKIKNEPWQHPGEVVDRYSQRRLRPTRYTCKTRGQIIAQLASVLYEYRLDHSTGLTQSLTYLFSFFREFRIFVVPSPQIHRVVPHAVATCCLD